MKSNTDSFCGLDVQKDYLSIVQYSSEEHAVTLVSIQPYSVEHEARDQWKVCENELKNIKGRLRFFSPSVICGLPSEYAIVKLCQLDADEKDGNEAIEWELSQQIIGSVDNYVFDYQEVVGGVAGTVKKMLVAAYRREIVHRVAGIVRSVKMAPCVIDLDIFALVNVFEANYPDKTSSPCLLVHSEPQQTKLVLTRHGGFLDYHSFEHTAVSANATGFAVALAAEIDRFFSAAGVAGGETGIFVSGSFFQQAPNRQAFFEKIPGAQILNPFREIKCQVAVDEQQIQEYATQLAVAVGLALRGNGRTHDKKAVTHAVPGADIS